MILPESHLLLFLRLTMAHLIADFFLQKETWVRQRHEKKWASEYLYVHGAIAAALAYLLAGIWYAFWLPVVIFISHVFFDGLKGQGKNTSQSFLLDQVGHFLVIFLCWVFLIKADPIHISDFPVIRTSNLSFWVLLLSYLLVTRPAGFLIGSITQVWREEIKGETSRGLARAGLWIGCLERILILTFVLLNSFQAIGFLIAAKSIFRFGEIRLPERRKEAEYILIGTLISFTIAIGLGMLVKFVLHYPLTG